MTFWSRIRDLVSGRAEVDPPLEARHERREAARQRHQETDEPPWTDDDRHPGADGERRVADVAPGTPGHFGSTRTIRDD
ncbi:MAG: hypothetical protein QOE42_18 [Chloroflexota bacterium]|jgi:hypothetical protein|nr:hypothetical protein [Chloroflexota bacterium]